MAFSGADESGADRPSPAIEVACDADYLQGVRRDDVGPGGSLPALRRAGRGLVRRGAGPAPGTRMGGQALRGPVLRRRRVRGARGAADPGDAHGQRARKAAVERRATVWTRERRAAAPPRRRRHGATSRWTTRRSWVRCICDTPPPARRSGQKCTRTHPRTSSMPKSALATDVRPSVPTTPRVPWDTPAIPIASSRARRSTRAAPRCPARFDPRSLIRSSEGSTGSVLPSSVARHKLANRIVADNLAGNASHTTRARWTCLAKESYPGVIVWSTSAFARTPRARSLPTHHRCVPPPCNAARRRRTSWRIADDAGG